MIIRKLTNPNLNNRIEFILFSILILFAFIMPIHADSGRKILTIAFIILIPLLDYKKMYSIIKNNLYIKYITLFILFCILSLLWTENYTEGKNLIRAMLRYWYVPTIVLISIINKNNIKYIITAFLSGMIINHFISYSIYFFKLNTFLGFNLRGASFDPVVFQASHMEYSIFVAISSLILFYYYLKSKNKKLKIILGILSLSMLTILFLLSGRTGQVAFILTSSILILIYFRRNIKLLVLFFITLIFIIYIAYSNSSTFNTRVNQGITDLSKAVDSKYATSLGIRLSAYRIIPEIIESTNIFIGVGIGDSTNITYKINKSLYNNNLIINSQIGKLHQSFLTIFHALGLIGLLLFTYSLYSLCKLENRNKDIEFIKYTFICSITISLITSEFMGQKEILLLLALFPSILIIENIEENYSIKEV